MVLEYEKSLLESILCRSAAAYEVQKALSVLTPPNCPGLPVFVPRTLVTSCPWLLPLSDQLSVLDHANLPLHAAVNHQVKHQAYSGVHKAGNALSSAPVTAESTKMISTSSASKLLWVSAFHACVAKAQNISLEHYILRFPE